MLNRTTNLKVIAAATAMFLVVSSLPTAANGKPQHRHERNADGRSDEERARELQHLLAGDPELALALREFTQQAEERDDHKRAAREAAAHEMMEDLRQLRVRQVNLQRDIQHAEVSADHLKVRELQREMIELEHQLQVGQLELEGIMLDRQRDAERRQMTAMNERFEYVAGWREVAFDPAQAVMMATQAIVELHLANDDAEGAAEKLESLLAKVGGEGSRTAIRFALRDIYTELGRPDKAAQHMAEVILENSPPKSDDE